MAIRHFKVDQERLARLCRRHGVRRLAVFGSVARGDSDPESDLDLLVEFLPGQRVGLRFITLQDELSHLFDREVDLSTPGFLSPHFRQRVLVDALPIYEAG
ncbi:MAG TPA: nucleotidyltransferase family protein [Thermoanaerobaculales bacterium]|nr:nucleotidyltransferase family protein [Thermoanaerobaculales bacterium]HPA79283.1 nucleotidyltransferase family protein [Thermoanaerobaculales bacterium]HQL29733.1 nucleotidyltransferase family protein [Thermoanaerobaculales bacterium]HQN95989.1 nucleotidyltransferase family protein [Thermoanaerobaculales bacterium]HQP43608.1 nucleotidyltransferase family protein [Thermoanaerobaculales bacterium]